MKKIIKEITPVKKSDNKEKAKKKVAATQEYLLNRISNYIHFKGKVL